MPEEVLFATKPQLTAALLEHAQSLGIRAAFVAGDEVYGGRELRRSIRQRGMGYVLAVRANHAVTAGRTVTAAAAAGLIPARAWHRMRTGAGTNGTRHYDWRCSKQPATIPRTGTGRATACCWPGGTTTPASCRSTGAGLPGRSRCLSKLIAIATARWRIEEDHQLSKQAAGLDAGQVIRWKSWHRWTAICLLAYLYLAVAVALQREHDADLGLDAGLIPVTVPELLRLSWGIVIPPPRRDRPHRLHWPDWRRRHPHRARQAHQRWNASAETTP